MMSSTLTAWPGRGGCGKAKSLGVKSLSPAPKDCRRLLAKRGYAHNNLLKLSFDSF
jgi:hypothetical protein